MRPTSKLARTTCFAASVGIRVTATSIHVKSEPGADGLHGAAIELFKMVEIRILLKNVAKVY